MRNQSDFTQRALYDQELYLADPVLPAHSPEAGSGQDNGSKVLLLIQLLQTRVQVPTLKTTVKDRNKYLYIYTLTCPPSPWEHFTFITLMPSQRIQYLWSAGGGISSSAEQRGAVSWCRPHYIKKHLIMKLLVLLILEKQTDWTGLDGTCFLAEHQEFFQHFLDVKPLHHKGFLSWKHRNKHRLVSGHRWTDDNYSIMTQQIPQLSAGLGSNRDRTDVP